MTGGAVSAVVDTNIFVSALLSPRGLPHALYAAWRAGAFTLHLAEAQRTELEEVLGRSRLRERFGLAPDAVAELFHLLRAHALPAPALDTPPIRVRDPKDDHILAAALGANVAYLVTGDDDLLSLADDPRLGALRIVTARAFLDALDPPTDEPHP